MSTPNIQVPDTHDAKINTSKSESDIGQTDSDIAKEELPSEEEVTYPEGGTRGWFVAGGASAILFSTFGYANSFGVFQEYYQTHQLRDSSPSQISWIGSIQIFFLFSTMAFGGPLFDMYGATVILIPAAIAYIFSIFMTSISTQYWHFMLAQGILGGLAMGMSMAPCMGAIGHYFNKKRGAAMGLAISGSSLGGIMFPLALGKMLYNPKLSFGWSIRICGFIIIALMSPAIVAVRGRLPTRRGQFFLPVAFKNFLFISIVFSSFLMMMGLFLPFFFLPSYAVAHGMSHELASYIVGILNAASFFGRVIPGVLGDKWGRLNILFFAGLGTAILIFCFTLMKTNATIILFSALYGFVQGAIISSMTVSLSTVPSDQKEMGTYMGMGMSVMSIAVLIGPPINGVFLTKYHGFTEVSYFGGAFVLVGALGVLVAKVAAKKGMFAIS